VLTVSAYCEADVMSVMVVLTVPLLERSSFVRTGGGDLKEDSR
jgi:hypothetical protein